MIVDIYIPIWVGNVTIVTKRTEFTENVVRNSLQKYAKIQPDSEKYIEEGTKVVMEELREFYSNPEWTGGVTITNDGLSFILLSDFDKDIANGFNSLTHEILHAVIDLLSAKGIKMTAATEEVYTYLMGYIVEEFCKQYFTSSKGVLPSNALKETI